MWFQVRARWPVPTSACVVWLLVGGVRSSGESPSGGSFHPGGRGRGEDRTGLRREVARIGVNMLIGGSTYRRRGSGLVLRAWPRPDVRRWRSRRGSKHQAKAQGRPFHPGATGERQIGRVKNLNLRSMSRYGQLRRWDAVAEHRDWSLESGRRWLGSPPSPDEHRRPRDTGGTHPGRSSCVRNAVTPVEVRAATSGKPTARKAQPLGGNLMTEKRNAGSRKTTGNRDAMASPSRLVVSDNWPDTGLVPGRESVLTRSGEPVRRR